MGLSTRIQGPVKAILKTIAEHRHGKGRIAIDIRGEGGSLSRAKSKPKTLAFCEKGAQRRVFHKFAPETTPQPVGKDASLGSLLLKNWTMYRRGCVYKNKTDYCNFIVENMPFRSARQLAVNVTKASSLVLETIKRTREIK